MNSTYFFDKTNFSDKFALNRALRIAIVVFSVVIATFSYNGSQAFWAPLAAFIVVNTPVGMPLRQNLLRFFIVLFAALIWSVLFSSLSTEALTIRLSEVALGSFLGIVINLLFLADPIYTFFRNNITKILTTYAEFFSEHTTHELIKNAPQIYLGWIYYPGFNPALRSSFRFFLEHSEQVQDILCSLEYLSQQPKDHQLWAPFYPVIKKCKTNTEKLFRIVVARLQNESVEEFDPNEFTDDIAELEKLFSEQVASSLEVLESKSEAMSLALFISNMRELRRILLLLAEAV